MFSSTMYESIYKIHFLSLLKIKLKLKIGIMKRLCLLQSLNVSTHVNKIFLSLFLNNFEIAILITKKITKHFLKILKDKRNCMNFFLLYYKNYVRRNCFVMQLIIFSTTTFSSL